MGKLITGVEAALDACDRLPIGRLNINITRDEVQYRFFPPSGRPSKFAVQVAERPSCNYGHYMLLLVTKGVAYLFDPDGGVNTELKKIINKIGLIYGGSLRGFLGIGQIPLRMNSGKSDCATWVALVYYHICKKNIRWLFRLSLREQRIEHDTFRSWIIPRVRVKKGDPVR